MDNGLTEKHALQQALRLRQIEVRLQIQYRESILRTLQAENEARQLAEPETSRLLETHAQMAVLQQDAVAIDQQLHRLQSDIRALTLDRLMNRAQS